MHWRYALTTATQRAGRKSMQGKHSRGSKWFTPSIVGSRPTQEQPASFTCTSAATGGAQLQQGSSGRQAHKFCQRLTLPVPDLASANMHRQAACPHRASSSTVALGRVLCPTCLFRHLTKLLELALHPAVPLQPVKLTLGRLHGQVSNARRRGRRRVERRRHGSPPGSGPAGACQRGRARRRLARGRTTPHL